MIIYLCGKNIKKYKGIINTKFKTVDISSMTGRPLIEARHTRIITEETDDVLR